MKTVLTLVMAGCLSTALLVAQSRSAGHVSQQARSDVPPAMTTRQVWAAPDVPLLAGSVSADGRRLFHTDWSTGDLAVRDLATGEPRRLTNKGPWSESIEFGLSPRISPDSGRVVYTWYTKDGFTELRIAGTDGSEPRVLYRDREADHLEAFGWSPDGRTVLALINKADRTNQIALMSAADGSVRVIKTLNWWWPLWMNLSPDGRYLVYDFPPKDDSPLRDIFLLSIDGGREITLVNDASDDIFPTWSPDGRHVLFVSDRQGKQGVWILPISNGNPSGTATFLRESGRILPVGMTRGGAFFYSVRNGNQDLYTAALDVASGTLLVPPAKATDRALVSNRIPAWSTDGRSLAYVTERETAQLAAVAPVLVTRDVATGKEREVESHLNYVNQIRWAPDGRSLLVVGRDRKNRQGLYRIGLEASETTPVVQSVPSQSVMRTCWSPDGKAIFFLRQEPKRSQIVRRALDTGEEHIVREALAPTSLRGIAVSPDGRRLALGWVNMTDKTVGLIVTSASGDAARDLLTAPAGDHNLLKGAVGEISPASLQWSPDGRHLLVLKEGDRRLAAAPQSNLEADAKHKSELWAIDADTGEKRMLDLAMGAVSDFAVHPDGSRIVFQAGISTTEVWVMENVFPPTTEKTTAGRPISRRR